jgi:RNA polymerase primary sigma factor
MTRDEEIESVARAHALQEREWAEILGYEPASRVVQPILEDVLPELPRGSSWRRGWRARSCTSHLRRSDPDRRLLEPLERWICSGGILTCASIVLNGDHAATSNRNVRTIRLPALEPTAEFKHLGLRLGELRSAYLELRNEFVVTHLGLACLAARSSPRLGLSYADQVQEGVLGLIKAFERYDPDRGMRFPTYARWWIRASIQRAVANTGRGIRLPCSTIDERRRLEGLRARFRALRGRDPTGSEIEDETGIDLERQDALVGDSTRMLLSLHHLPPGDKARELMEEIADRGAPSATEAIDRGRAASTVRAALNGLPDRERDIVRLRFGLDGEQAHTLRAIGDRYDITRERVRQIESRALDRMRVRLQEVG